MKILAKFVCLTALAIVVQGYADTETVNGITWMYTVANGEVSIGGGSSSSTAVPTSTSGQLTIPSTLGGKPVTRIGDYAFNNCRSLTSVAIPDSVTNIGNQVFNYCTNLTSVTIPNSMTSIGTYAFYNCSGLKSVKIPDSVTSIGSSAFRGCSGLTSVTIPQYVCTNKLSSVFSSAYQSITNMIIAEGVTSIGSYAFSTCKGLTSVTIPDSVTSIGEEAFYNCSGLNGVHISDLAAWCKISFKSENSNPLTYAHNLYLNDKLVTNLIIPDGVTSIGNRAFQECYSITNVTIPHSIKGIGEYAFNGCVGFNDIVVPNSVTDIGKGCFTRCTNLVSVTLPFVGSCRGSDGDKTSIFGHIFGEVMHEGLTKIVQSYKYGSNSKTESRYISARLKSVTITDETILPKGAFDNCCTIEEIILNEGITKICEYALSGCSGLTGVTIPDSVTNVGYSAFPRWKDLPSREDGYKVINGWLVGYSDGADETISNVDELRGIAGGSLEGCTALRSLEFSDQAIIGSICEAAFKGCTELQSLVLPPSLKFIGDEAFMGCSYLSNVIVPGSVKSVGARAFKNCTGFTNAQIEYGVESLGEEAFYGDWRISEVDIPSTVTSIGRNAFGGDSSIIRIGVRGDVRTVAEIFSNYKLIREATVKEGAGAIVDGLFTNCTQLADVRFFGDCPALVNDGANLYKGAKSSVKTYVSQDSTGWDGTPGSHQLPQAWPLTGSYRRSIAYWDVPTYLVEFDSNGGTLGVQSTYQYSERQFALPPEPVQSGYSFAGWWTKPRGGLQVTADTVFIEGVYRRLYAHWVKGHWVFLNPNGGTVTNDFVTYIEQTVYGVLPAAVRTGYAFGGWEYNGQTVLPTTPISTTADHTLTAQWEAYKYSVRFNANGGEGEMVDLEMTYDVEQTLPENGFRRNGYALELFAVWKKDGSNVTLEGAGDEEWAIDPSVMHDGAVAWRSGAIGDDQNSVLRTTVVGKGRVSFYWKVDCEWFRTLRLDSLAFSVDGQEIQWINGNKDWLYVEFDIVDGGEHTLEWAYAKDGQDDAGDYQDCGWISEIVWLPVLETLNDYLNCTNLVFETLGDATWFGVREVSHDGFGALRSGVVGDNGRSYIDATVNGPAVVSFWWRADCEPSFRTYVLDHLAFYVDGEEKFVVNDDSGWEYKTIMVGEGQHTLSWIYEKDEEGSDGLDCAWLDEVMCVPLTSGVIVDTKGKGTVMQTTGAYLVSANAGATLTAADIKVYSTMDGVTVETTKGYKVVVDDGGKTATVTLLSPYEVARTDSNDSLWIDNGDGTVTLNIEIVPGLYYAAASATSLEAFHCPGSASPATADTILKVAKPNSDSQGFFKVWVSDAAIAPDGN